MVKSEEWRGAHRYPVWYISGLGRAQKRGQDTGQTVEPEHVLIFFVAPGFKLGEDISPGPLHASLSVSTEVSRVGSVRHPVETREGHTLLQSSYNARKGDQGVRLTISLQFLS